MVDDLTRLGLEEPYRLFTSRAEYRLLLGVDTVLARLLPHGRRLGLISQREQEDALLSEERLATAHRELERHVVHPTREAREHLRTVLGIDVTIPTSAYNLLKRNDLSVNVLERYVPGPFAPLSREEKSILENRVRYEGYIRREQERLGG